MPKIRYYGIDTNVGKYGHSEIYDRIQSAFDNNIQDFDWADRKSEVYDTFFSYVDSSDCLTKLKKRSKVLSEIGDATSVLKDTLAMVGEAESYAIADEKLVELLKYIRSRTTDSALSAACDEIIRTKIRPKEPAITIELLISNSFALSVICFIPPLNLTCPKISLLQLVVLGGEDHDSTA